jgi:hypothetical protein
MRSKTWSDSSSTARKEGAQSLLESIQRLDLESSERRKQQLEEQRTQWESTLPKPLPVHLPEHT